MNFIVILSTLVASATASVVGRSGAHMTQAAAQAKLEAAGVYASSSGGCTSKSNPKCTSYDGILSGTVDNVITLKNACSCAITITGGTEVGHASGTYSHANGYKVDIRHASGIDEYVKSKFTKIGNRGDGYPQWKSAAGNIYCDEGTHWDVTYY
ncbi:putative effector protein [Ceratobasidium theobromae]|uniref:Putative effector protein n=1 Tax=Ceratobasidium theobromae TaxID=1582974 RepID=A0A5N5QWR9_9AGAM|nr:putative effector protein [Ceratobasidium theobromae]